MRFTPTEKEESICHDQMMLNPYSAAVKLPVILPASSASVKVP